MTSTFARLTKKLVDRGRFTVTELCDKDLADCSERHFYNWLNGDAHLPDYKVERLANYFSRHRETEPISSFYGPEYTLIQRVFGKRNGSVKDDIVESLHALTRIDESHGKNRKADSKQALEVLRQKLADFEAEVDLLPE